MQYSTNMYQNGHGGQEIPQNGIHTYLIFLYMLRTSKHRKEPSFSMVWRRMYGKKIYFHHGVNPALTGGREGDQIDHHFIK